MIKLREHILPGDGSANGGGNETRTARLDDILDDLQILEIERIANDNSDDPDAMLVELKKYLKTQETALAKKGVDSQYLAYFIYAKITGAV